MAKNKLYQCPYDNAVKCDMKDPCIGCEDFSPSLVVVKKPVKQQRKRVIFSNSVCAYCVYDDDVCPSKCYSHNKFIGKNCHAIA